MEIIVLATGGTFDKVYCDALSDYQIGKPQIIEILQQSGVNFDYQVEEMIGKDSLDMTDDDRKMIYERIKGDNHSHFVIIHGTDTMTDTARCLSSIENKIIVLTGAMQPARFRDSDAQFNAGFAFSAVQLLSPGTYIAMNGQVFDPNKTVKNRTAGSFERI